MTKWEYKVVEFDARGALGGLIDQEKMELKLNELGREGWELVTSYSTQQGYGSSRKLVYTFKRESQF
jgi:hypothetical protein